MADTQEHEKPARPIKPDHRRFIGEYISNGNNAVQAYRTVRPNTTYNSAGVAGHRLLNQPKIQNEMQAIAESVGMSSRFRLEKLYSDLCTESVTSEQTRYNADGEVIERVAWKRQRTPSETAKLVDVVNKSTGLYERNRAIGNALSSQFKSLARRYAPRLRATGKDADTTKAVDANVPHDDVWESIQYACVGGCVVQAEGDA